MGDWPLIDGQRAEMAGADATASAGTLVTAGGANTKGSWVQLVASTANDANAVMVNTRKGSAAADFLVDIGIGGSGSEAVIIPNLRADVGTGNLFRSSPSIWPVGIPRGTRVAARCQSTTAAATLRAQAMLLAGSFISPSPLARVTDYGTNTADSGAVSVDPGAVSNTKGAYSQITASTTFPTKAVMIGIGNQADTSRAAYNWLLDIAIGAAASEVVIIPDVHVESSTQGDEMCPVWIGPIPLSLPAGTRIAARAAVDTNAADAADRLFDVTVYGID